MAKNSLSPKIIKYFKDILGVQEPNLRNNVARIRQRFNKVTINAAAHLFAQERGKGIRGMLSKEDKDSLPVDLQIEKARPKLQQKEVKKKEKKIQEFFKFESSDSFVRQHIIEINKCATFTCFTAATILSRKVIENLIIEILRNKYPEKKKEHKEKYYDLGKTRYLDFSVILRNLFDAKNEFDHNAITPIQTLYNLCKGIKTELNDKTHSLYHIVKNKEEFDKFRFQDILDLIKKINKYEFETA